MFFDMHNFLELGSNARTTTGKSTGPKHVTLAQHSRPQGPRKMLALSGSSTISEILTFEPDNRWNVYGSKWSLQEQKNLLLAPKTSHRLWNLPSVFTFQNSRHWEYIGSFSNTIFVALSLSFLDFLRTGSNTKFRELMGIRAVTTPYCSRCCFAKMRFSHEEGCTISAQCQQKRQQKARNGTNGFGAVG